MSITLAQHTGKKPPLRAKLWPNGELSIHRPRKFKFAPLESPAVNNADSAELNACLVRGYGPSGAIEARRALGLSNARNFDKASIKRVRYGLKGLPGGAKRTIRNGAYLLAREAGRRRLTFATVTIPDLEPHEMELVHVGWSKVIDAYRREMARELKRHGLSGELVGVTEIQPGRHSRTGIPSLHGHFLFIGRSVGAGWAISPARHDAIWRAALSVVICMEGVSVSSACQLDSVRERVDLYLAKYMVSKGNELLESVIAAGLEGWLPKQWWSMSRSMSRRVRSSQVIFTHGLSWLMERTGKEKGIFAFCVPIEVVDNFGIKHCVATYGKLTPQGNALVRKVLKLKPRASTKTSRARQE